jgi:hypothetical protein
MHNGEDQGMVPEGHKVVKSQHTPTPWSVCPGAIYGPGNPMLAEKYGKAICNSLGVTNWEANAQFIVTACNNFSDIGMCVEVCGRLIRKLKASGYTIDNRDKSHADVLAALDTCILPKAGVQVVVAVEGGVVQDTFAYTNGALADAKQAELDKLYGIERDADGYVTNESDNVVITYVLPLDKE